MQDDISDIIAIVQPETYCKWRDQSRDGKVAIFPPHGGAQSTTGLLE